MIFLPLTLSVLAIPIILSAAYYPKRQTDIREGQESSDSDDVPNLLYAR